MTALIPLDKEWSTMKDMSSMLVKTGFLPQTIQTPQQAISIMLKGRELNIPPMQALSQINVIKGKPAISSELMLALIYRQCPSVELEWTEMTDTVVACKVKRHSKQNWQAFKWTLQDADKAGLLSNHSWRKYPRALLRSRVVSEMARAVFPDAIMGCSYTPEELGETVNEECEIIKVEKPIKVEPKIEQPKHEEEIVEVTEVTEVTEQPKDLPKKQTAYGYQGTKAQQEAVKKYAIENGLDEEYWEDLHKNMMGKSKEHLTDEIMKLLEQQKKERNI